MQPIIIVSRTDHRSNKDPTIGPNKPNTSDIEPIDKDIVERLALNSVEIGSINKPMQPNVKPIAAFWYKNARPRFANGR